jgi:hypothetical protein
MDRHVNELVGALEFFFFFLRSGQRFSYSIILEVLIPITSGPSSVGIDLIVSLRKSTVPAPDMECFVDFLLPFLHMG